jgi:hypothetical protein
MYPPTISTIAFNGLENVNIKFTCGGARVLPIITSNDIGIHAYNACVYPFHKKTDRITNDSSNAIAL